MPPISKSELFAQQPPVHPVPAMPLIQEAAREAGVKLVVLDDDPTGTQTVRGVPVLTEWSVERLRAEFADDGGGFFILTNSRSLDAAAAEAVNREIIENLKAAAGGRAFSVVSRSDSTLRGHYDVEVSTLAAGLGPFDGVLLAPYFEAGGRYTIDDVHYVAEGDQLVPAAETPFAADATFGYRHSNLRDWVAEKTGGRVSRDSVVSIPLITIRHGGPDAVAERLRSVAGGVPVIVNAAAPEDIEVVVAGLLAAERAGKKFLFRTAAQFVSARLGMGEVAAWQPPPRAENDGAPGGLVIVGSHVPKSTMQLSHLLEHGEMTALELPVGELLSGGEDCVSRLAANVDEAVQRGEDVVVYTSRDLVMGADSEASLKIANVVSRGLVSLLRQVTRRPAFLIAKGGITSSDLATKGLGIRRALVLGPLLPGVPVWETGPETRFPGLPYVVFPGNVGNVTSLLAGVEKFRRQEPSVESK